MKYDVFISYSRKDTAVADQVCAAFDKAGITYFIDRHDIGCGMEFPQVIASAIKDSEIFLFLASENAYQSSFTNREIQFAFNKKHGKNLFPYIIDNHPLPLALEFVFSTNNWRTIKEHPIDSVLVDDILRMLGRQRTQQNVKQNTQQEMEELCEKGNTLDDGGRYPETLSLYREAAEQGDVESLYNLGLMYEEGQGVPQNYAEAAKWYRKAAEQGHADAQYKLGWMYEGGHGVKFDRTEAVWWYRKSAEQGNARGQSYLGSMYWNGLGVKQDFTEAVKWFMKAAEQGDASGQYGLGWMYFNGKGVPQDFSEAIKWYRKAAEQWHVGARNKLGDMYFYGLGVAKDTEEAKKWFGMAAAQGNEEAKEKLKTLSF